MEKRQEGRQIQKRNINIEIDRHKCIKGQIHRQTDRQTQGFGASKVRQR